MTVYVGPYLFLPTKVVVEEEIVRCCEKCDSKPKEKNAKFCSKCGGAIIEKSISKEIEKDLHWTELDSIFHDDFSCPEYHSLSGGNAWFQNYTRTGDGVFRFHDDFMTTVDLETYDVAEVKRRFESRHADIIKHIKNDHKFDVEVRVGVVEYSY